MRVTTVLLAALTAFAAKGSAQAVPEGIAPEEGPPEGCETSVDGNFTIGIALLAKRHRRESAQEAAGSALACTLQDGILKDPYDRVGSVVANYQFQFDGPPQAGAIYTGGFSVCKNGSLALGDSTIWYRCMSGEFGNLYDRWIGEQCSEVRIVAQMIEEPKPSSSATPTPTPSSAESEKPEKTESGEDKKSSTWSVESATTSVPVTMTSGNQTAVSTSMPESSDSPSGSATPTPSEPSETDAASTDEPPAPTGAATKLARGETFGAVVAVLGAALLL